MAQPDSLAVAFARLAEGSPSEPLVVSPSRAPVSARARGMAQAADPALSCARPDRGPVGLAAPNGPAFLAGVLALRRRGAIVLLLERIRPRPSGGALRPPWGPGPPHCSVPWPMDSAAFSCEALLPAPPPPTSRGHRRGQADLGLDGRAARRRGRRRLSSPTTRPWPHHGAACRRSHPGGDSDVAFLRLLERGPARPRPRVAVVVPAEAGRSRRSTPPRAAATVFPSAPAYLQALLKLSRPPSWPRRAPRDLGRRAPSADTAASSARPTASPCTSSTARANAAGSATTAGARRPSAARSARRWRG